MWNTMRNQPKTRQFVMTYQMASDIMKRTKPGVERPGLVLTNNLPSVKGTAVAESQSTPAPVIYKACPGFPLYLVGDNGEVWSSYRGRWSLRMPVMDDSGHLKLFLYKDGKKYYRRVHQIVLETFVGPCPPGTEACHDPDPDPSNNRLDNLRWDTHKANILDSIKLGRMANGSRNGSAKMTEANVREASKMREQGASWAHLGRTFGVHPSTVYRAVSGQNWKCIR